MDVKLVMIKGRTPVRTIELRRPETVIGRRSGCNLRIPSAEISRRHCRLHLQNNLLTVEDLDSVNGTFVNGQRITGKRVLHPGDQLQVGPVQFTVQYQIKPAARKAGPPPESALDVLPAEELPMAEFAAEPLSAEELEVEVVDDAPAPTAGGVTSGDDQPLLLQEDDEPILLEADDDAPVVLELDEEDLGHLPDGNDFRDILSKLDH